MVSATWLEIKYPLENSGIFYLEVPVSNPGEQGKS